MRSAQLSITEDGDLCISLESESFVFDKYTLLERLPPGPPEFADGRLPCNQGKAQERRKRVRDCQAVWRSCAHRLPRHLPRLETVIDENAFLHLLSYLK